MSSICGDLSVINDLMRKIEFVSCFYCCSLVLLEFDMTYLGKVEDFEAGNLSICGLMLELSCCFVFLLMLCMRLYRAVYFISYLSGR